MAHTRKTEQRYLTADELELVAQSHQPALGGLSDDALTRLAKLVRERRDRAGDLAKQQRREMRGKGQPRGARPAAGDFGTRIKAEILAQAVKRTNRERERRRVKAARADLAANAARALAMRRSGETASRPAPTRTAHKGMRAKPSKKAQAIADPREAGRVSQFVKTAQAKRDK